MNAKHTPTPWKSGYMEMILDQNDKRVASVFNLADAAFIVRAVNSHEAMLEALKETSKLFAELRRTMDDGHWFADDLDTIGRLSRNAIARAEGRE